MAERGTTTSAARAVGWAVLALLAAGLVWGAVALARQESAPADRVPGTLVSVDHRDGGNSGTGVVTVSYPGPDGRPATAQVVLRLDELSSLDPGTPVTVFVRDGQAVSEPAHFGPRLAIKLVQALIVWIALAFAVTSVVRRVERRGSSQDDLSPRPPN